MTYYSIQTISVTAGQSVGIPNVDGSGNDVAAQEGVIYLPPGLTPVKVRLDGGDATLWHSLVLYPGQHIKIVGYSNLKNVRFTSDQDSTVIVTLGR